MCLGKRLGCLLYLLRVKKVILVPLREFRLKYSTVGAFVVLYRVYVKKNNMTGER